MRNYCWKMCHKKTLKHCNVHSMMLIILNNLEWHRHLSFLKSRAPIEHLSIISEFIFSSGCFWCSSNNNSDKWNVAIMQSMLNEISNQFTRAGGAKKREGRERGVVKCWGCIQQSEVAQHLQPDWCDAPQRDSGTYLNHNTSPPSSNWPDPTFTARPPPAQSSRPWRGSITRGRWRQKPRIALPAGIREGWEVWRKLHMLTQADFCHPLPFMCAFCISNFQLNFEERIMFSFSHLMYYCYSHHPSKTI